MAVRLDGIMEAKGETVDCAFQEWCRDIGDDGCCCVHASTDDVDEEEADEDRIVMIPLITTNSTVVEGVADDTEPIIIVVFVVVICLLPLRLRNVNAICYFYFTGYKSSSHGRPYSYLPRCLDPQMEKYNGVDV